MENPRNLAGSKLVLPENLWLAKIQTIYTLRCMKLIKSDGQDEGMIIQRMFFGRLAKDTIKRCKKLS